ncbi:hypothetical protein NPIL_432201 [Nephila pilipes]|uniref:Uncharacterized protein n=1 Tax=Nephila pilipes TaxID=299642 RepID=A0A8X6UH87_NEPPI|nr:hypothetical protein NPIL_432201 [Nephila pilipes]
MQFVVRFHCQYPVVSEKKENEVFGNSTDECCCSEAVIENQWITSVIYTHQFLIYKEKPIHGDKEFCDGNGSTKPKDPKPIQPTQKQRYPQYEDTELYQIEKNELKILERKLDQMVSAFQTTGPCEINGCPHHSHLNLNLSQNQNPNLSPKPTTSKQFKRKEKNGFISPPTKKTAKIISTQNPSQNLLITNNSFQGLNNISNETSDSPTLQKQLPITQQNKRKLYICSSDYECSTSPDGAIQASETEVYAQNEARFHRKQPQNTPPTHTQYNRQGNNLAQPTDLLFILADLLNKFPGLAQQLPRIAAVKNNRNKKYAIIEAFLESESYV